MHDRLEGNHMARANAPSLRGTENRTSTSPRRSGTDVLLPRTIDVTLKHLSMLGIGEKLGDTMSGLALIAVPSMLKYHSRAGEASEKRLFTKYSWHLDFAYPLMAQLVEGTRKHPSHRGRSNRRSPSAHLIFPVPNAQVR